jgi:hypothetical protein
VFYKGVQVYEVVRDVSNVIQVVVRRSGQRDSRCAMRGGSSNKLVVGGVRRERHREVEVAVGWRADNRTGVAGSQSEESREWSTNSASACVLGSCALLFAEKISGG